jgi:hypothetical protein
MITLNNQDITSLVDITSITTNDTLDESLASGSMIIPLSPQKSPYARFSEVRIDGLLFVVAEDMVRLVKKTEPKQYRHEISLIEPTKILQKRVIPNLTVTQPQGDIQNYIFSVNRFDSELLVNTTPLTVPLTTTSQSQDTNVINGLTLKNTDAYQIYVSLTVENNQFSDGTISSNPRLDFEVEMFYGTTSIETKTYSINGKNGIFANPIIFSGAFTKIYTPTAENSINFKVRCLPPAPFEQPDQATLTEFVVNVAQVADNNLEIKLDQVVDKLLQFHPQFTLSETTRTRISQIKSPEFTFQNYTLYDALKEVANYRSAIVYLGEDDFSTIHFYFYDQVLNETIDFADQEQTEYLDGFTDGFEINATNVIRDDDQLFAIYEPDQLSFMTVRGTSDERGVQIIDTQTALQLEHGIYRPIQVRVKGLAFEMRDESNQVVNFPNTQVWDITSYVVEQQRYNTFETEEVTNGRGVFKRKSNTIYYVQGQPLIQGLGFTGTVPPAWNTALTPNYAIVEAILNTAQDENPTYSFTTNYFVESSIHDLQFRIRHIPYSNVRLTVYKDNTRGRNIMYFNEQAPLNDMELLGRIAQENVNRSGNRVVRYEGLTNNNQLLLGSKQGNEVLVNYTISRTPTINKFVAEYAVGYANLSNYVGVDSRYRQYEVPTDTIVSRRDKLTQFFTMTVSNTAPNVLVPDYLDTQNNTFFDSMFANFKSSITGSRPTYARIVLDNDKVVQSTIDAYRMGKTLGLAINMLDNYSAGIKKSDRQLNTGVNIKVQEDARYTDDFGNFTEAEIEFYDGGGAVSLAESNLYPDNDKAGVFKLLDYTYTVNKDAREQWGFIYEVVFQSDITSANKTYVYDGFVKYNRLATEITPTKAEIRFLEKGYLPDRNLDINRTTLGTGTVSVPSGERYLQIQATAPEGEYEGLILTINDEPIIAIQSSDYDFGLQVTRYIYPRAFDDNDYELGFTETVFLTLTVNGFVTTLKDDTASAIINTAFTATGNAQESLSDSAQATISLLFNIIGNVFLDDVGTASANVSTNFTAIGDIFIEQDGTMLTTVSAVFTTTGDVFIEQEDSASDTVALNLNATGEITTFYNLRGYATATPVNIVVDFDDTPAFSFTLQTFTQIIATRENGTDVTVTAPSSYTLNGFTYTFVDWRVDETNQTSTNRVFTTTIDQQKTLRLRYIAFGFN